MKAYKNIGFGPRKSKKGFTLIELLIVMVILAILAGVVVMAVGGIFGTSRQAAYTTTQGELKNAVAQYASDNAGDLPIASAFASNVSENGSVVCGVGSCNVIDIDELLLGAGGILGSAPDSCTAANSDDGNCDDPVGSYTWVMDGWGNVYSACTTSACATAGGGNASSGYINGYIDPEYP